MCHYRPTNTIPANLVFSSSDEGNDHAYEENRALVTNNKEKTTSLSLFLKRKVPTSLKKHVSEPHHCCDDSTVVSDLTTEDGNEFSKRRNTVKKSVSFRNSVAMKLTMPRKEYLPEEITATWYTKEEYADIQKECVKQVRRMDNGEILRDKKYCSRGLESYTMLGAQSKTQNRQAAYAAVLDEQDRQEDEQICDDELLSKKYNSVSSSCQMWAAAKALNDQRAAEDYMLYVE